LGASQPLELPFLQHAKQLCLHLERQLADLVQEDGAPVRELEAALLLLDRAREGAALVSEQLALDERRRQRRAVDLHHHVAAAAARLVDGARHQFFACPGLSTYRARRALVRPRPGRDHSKQVGWQNQVTDARCSLAIPLWAGTSIETAPSRAY